MGLQLLKSTLVLGNLKVYVRGFLVSFSFLCSYLQYGHLYFADLRNQSLFVEEMLVFIINYSTKVHKLINWYAHWIITFIAFCFFNHKQLKAYNPCILGYSLNWLFPLFKCHVLLHFHTFICWWITHDWCYALSL